MQTSLPKTRSIKPIETTDMQTIIKTIRSGAFAFAFSASLCTSQAAVSYADLLVPNASITSGDKIFYNFTTPTQVGNLTVNLSDIFITPIQKGPDYGIRFQSALWQLSGTGLTYDMEFEYDVRTVSGQPWIIGNTLEMTAGHSGTGTATIDENVLAKDALGFVADQIVYLNVGTPSTSDLIDSDIYPTGYFDLRVKKDLAMSTGANGVISVSGFDQTFSQIPEPASALASGVLLTCCLVLRRRDRQLA